MSAYSVDLRKKIVESVRRGISKSETASRFGVDRSAVKRYLKRLDEGGPLAPNPGPGKRPKLDHGLLTSKGASSSSRFVGLR